MSWFASEQCVCGAVWGWAGWCELGFRGKYHYLNLSPLYLCCFLLKERFIVTSHGDISCYKGNNAATHNILPMILMLFLSMSYDMWKTMMIFRLKLNGTFDSIQCSILQTFLE